MASNGIAFHQLQVLNIAKAIVRRAKRQDDDKYTKQLMKQLETSVLGLEVAEKRERDHQHEFVVIRNNNTPRMVQRKDVPKGAPIVWGENRGAKTKDAVLTLFAGEVAARLAGKPTAASLYARRSRVLKKAKAG